MGALPFFHIKQVRTKPEIIAQVNRAYDPEAQAALKRCCDGIIADRRRLSVIERLNLT